LPKLIVHQALHGYAEGHRELSTSLRLKPRDAKTVLVLSDIASSGLRISSEGYLTGYPLPESGYYALARTWSATEIVRPGAVWTHTLLVEFADLAMIRDAQVLLSLFRRPSAHPMGLEFDEPIRLVESAVEAAMTPEHHIASWSRQLVAVLYSLPTERIVAAIPLASNEDIERSVLSIWSQQWPRLRRTFRFCTMTSADRSVDKVGFDLQLLPESERGIRSRFAGARYANEEPPTKVAWVEYAFRDLEFPQSSGLREFLQKVGGDVASGRRAFAPLVRLHMLLTGHPGSDMDWSEALRLLESELGTAVMSAKGAVVSAAARSALTLDAVTLDFVFENLDLIGEEDLEESAVALGKAAWRISPERLARMREGTEPQQIVAKSTLAALDESALLVGLEAAPNLVDAALNGRPNLAKSPALWRAGPRVVEQALRVVAADPDTVNVALNELLERNDSDLVDMATSVLTAHDLWRSLAPALEFERHSTEFLLPWLRVALRDGGAIAHVLASGGLTRRQALATVARITSPDAVPNDYGDDPWVIANRQSTGALTKAEAVYFSSYLLARALGPRSRNCADLVEMSFGEVYGAAAENQIGWDAWNLLDARLPQPNYWQRWDRCKQLRYGIAQLYVRRDLSAASFARLGRTDQDFAVLVRAAVKEWHGRDFLRQVRNALNREPAATASRIHAIEESLSGWSL
jgi:hypothetical protein